MLETKLARRPRGLSWLPFGIVLVLGLGFAASELLADLAQIEVTSATPFALLGLALLVALGFEFVNGFHDTANAVATVIYTHALDPHVAVVWSGICNFLGVLTSSGAVAFGIISLLPVELILQVGSGSGFAMVFALLSAAILWNLGTWYLGLPASSSHTLIGSIVGVGLANQFLHGNSGTSGVDWAQASTIGKSLLISPLVGFGGAALLFLLSRKLIKNPKLYRAPEGEAPPPFWIRCLLVLTCSGVSFAHGSNDGQKGMGLIMLILVGTVPTAYALNHAVPYRESADFVAVSQSSIDTVERYAAAPSSSVSSPASPTNAPRTRDALIGYIRVRELAPTTLSALAAVMRSVSDEVSRYRELKKVPKSRVGNLRNDMYLVSETLRLLDKDKASPLSEVDRNSMKQYKSRLDGSTKFIPIWVKVAVALALGLGTMVGWKRIVVTVGERIGKDHLTYAQGGAAELTAMLTIGAADAFGLPVSTTHVLSSGVAGTMAANRSGVQMSTVRNLLMAWVLTLPASIVLAGAFFWLFELIAR